MRGRKEVGREGRKGGRKEEYPYEQWKALQKTCAWSKWKMLPDI